jgi:hypothetical protein
VNLVQPHRGLYSYLHALQQSIRPGSLFDRFHLAVLGIGIQTPESYFGSFFLLKTDVNSSFYSASMPAAG